MPLLDFKKNERWLEESEMVNSATFNVPGCLCQNQARQRWIRTTTDCVVAQRRGGHHVSVARKVKRN
jgi:hypothetical protein